MHENYRTGMIDPVRRIEEDARRRRRPKGRRRADRKTKTGPYLPGFVPRHRIGGPAR